MIGVLNVLYENRPSEVEQYYRELERNAAAEKLSYRIFVIDNSSTSLKSLVPEGASYRHFPENTGYTRALNLLMAEAFAAGCDLVLATNVDGFPMPGCISNLIETFSEHGGNALVEARQFPKEHRKSYDRDTGATNWVTGCCLLVGRAVAKRLGPLDEAFFLYSEDVDYSFRAQRAGIACVVSDSALFFHRHEPPSGNSLRHRYQLISGRYVAVKWQCQATMKLREDTMIASGLFPAPDTFPAFPPDMETFPCPITWEPANGAIFAPQRWAR